MSRSEGTRRAERAGALRSASERFRRASGRRLAVGLAASLALHAAFLLLPSGLDLGPGPVPATAPRLLILPPAEPPAAARPPAVRLPPPPVEIRRPGEPVVGAAPAADAPEWIPHDVAPRLLNTDEVRGRLASAIEALEGTSELLVVLWLYVERSGDVTRLRLRRSSGREGVDAAAMDVARAMRFSPALFRGRTVAVWIVQPIRFSLRVADGSRG